MSPARSTRLALALVAVPSALGTSEAAAQTPAPSTQGTIIAIGSASVRPVPADAKSNDSIAAAVSAARHEAIPRALGDARARASLLADAGNLKLGALLSIADGTTSPFFYSPFGQDGTFGPGKYCGLVSHYRTTRTNGIYRRKLLSRTRSCRVPRQVTATETVTFATSS